MSSTTRHLHPGTPPHHIIIPIPSLLLILCFFFPLPPPVPASPPNGNKWKTPVLTVKGVQKCDDQRPCSRCVKYGIEDGCINSQRKERKRKAADSDDVPARRSTSPQLSSTTRVQLNLRRLRTEEPAAFDPSTSPLLLLCDCLPVAASGRFPKNFSNLFKMNMSTRVALSLKPGSAGDHPVCSRFNVPASDRRIQDPRTDLFRDLHTVLNQPIPAAAVSPAAQSVHAAAGFRYPNPLPSSQPPFLLSTD